MITSLSNHHVRFSRRDFLKLAGLSSLSLAMAPYIDKDWSADFRLTSEDLKHPYGRVISGTVDVYRKPSLESELISTLWKDSVLKIESVTIGDEENAYNRTWYEMSGAGYVHSGKIQPVDIRQNPVHESLPDGGALVELTVPFSDAVWNPKSPHLVVYRLYFGSVFWAKGVAADKNRKLWYLIKDDKWDLQYYVEASHLHIIQPNEISPISPTVPENEKRIEILLADQAVIAYEYDRPVFLARTATGARFIDGDFRTQPGDYITNRKRPSRHMAAGDPAAPNSYDLPGIPWISYLTESGVSFHGTYWHNDYGKPRSHGCINLTPDDALWIYRWTNPVVSQGEVTKTAKTGTWVKIM